MVVVCFTMVALFTGCGTEQTTTSTSNEEKIIPSQYQKEIRRAYWTRLTAEKVLLI